MLQQLFGVENTLLIARVLAFVIAIPFHEVSHAFVSDKLGDHTARNAGRLTLNPVKHFDLVGFLSMLIIGVGWAKPVPVNPAYYKNRKLGMALTSAAGPASNLLLAFVAVIFYKVAYYSGWAWAIGQGLAALPFWVEVTSNVLFWFGFINVSLALFNLLPIPPLDGSRILGLVLPEKLYFGIMKYERYVMFGLFAVLIILPRVANVNPLGWLSSLAMWVMNGMMWLSGPVDWLFGY